MLTLPLKAGAIISECSVVVSPAPRAFLWGQGRVLAFGLSQKGCFLYAHTTIGHLSPLVCRAFANSAFDSRQHINPVP